MFKIILSTILLLSTKSFAENTACNMLFSSKTQSQYDNFRSDAIEAEIPSGRYELSDIEDIFLNIYIDSFAENKLKLRMLYYAGSTIHGKSNATLLTLSKNILTDIADILTRKQELSFNKHSKLDKYETLLKNSQFSKTILNYQIKIEQTLFMLEMINTNTPILSNDGKIQDKTHLMNELIGLVYGKVELKDKIQSEINEVRLANMRLSVKQLRYKLALKKRIAELVVRLSLANRYLYYADSEATVAEANKLKIELNKSQQLLRSLN